jgi:ssDNA-binding protein
MFETEPLWHECPDWDFLEISALDDEIEGCACFPQSTIDQHRGIKMKLILKHVRLAFPDLWTAKPFKEGDKPKFKATFLLTADDSQVDEIEEAIAKVAAEAWTEQKAKSILGSIRGNVNKFCLQNGDNKSHIDGYPGNWYIGASSKVKPLVIDRNKKQLSEQDGVVYGGCYVNASIEIFAYENSGKGIAASLRGVQYDSDGDAFAGGTPANPDEFEDLGVDTSALA